MFDKPGGFLTVYGDNQEIKYYEIIGAGKQVGLEKPSAFYRIYEDNIMKI